MKEDPLNKNSKTDWARVAAMTDEEVDTNDIPPLADDFFINGELRLPKQKPMISIGVV